MNSGDEAGRIASRRAAGFTFVKSLATRRTEIAKQTRNRSGGFTLGELLIAMAVIAILTAIALPSYKYYMIRSNRSAAQQFMATVASREEQVLLDLRSYVAVSATANFPNAPTAGSPGLNMVVPTEASNYYTFTVTAQSGPPPSYLVSGVPIAGKTNASDHTLYLNSNGQRWRDFDGNTTYDPPTDLDWSAR